MTEFRFLSEKHRNKVIIGSTILFIIIISVFVSFSLEGKSYSFEEILEIREEINYYIFDYPVVDEVIILALDSNSENINFTLYGSGHDYRIEESYSLHPGQFITSNSDWNLGGDITLQFHSQQSVQIISITVRARSNLFFELLSGMGFPYFDGLGYFIYIFIPSFFISGILFFFALSESYTEECKDDSFERLQSIAPILFFISYLTVITLLRVKFFIPIPTVIYFYYCINLLRLTLKNFSVTSSKNQFRQFIVVLSLLLTLAPFYIFIGYEEARYNEYIPVELRIFSLLILIVCLYFFSSFLAKQRFLLPFWSSYGVTLIASSAFFYLLYSPLHVELMRGKSVWNTLPILPINISFIITGLILIVYGFRTTSPSPKLEISSEGD